MKTTNDVHSPRFKSQLDPAFSSKAKVKSRDKRKTGSMGRSCGATSRQRWNARTLRKVANVKEHPMGEQAAVQGATSYDVYRTQ